MTPSIEFKPAEASDAFRIMQLYQLSAMLATEEPLFQNHRALSEVLQAKDFVCLIGKKGGQNIAFLSAKLDIECRLLKIHRLYVLPGEDEHSVCSRAAFLALSEFTQENLSHIDLLYSTTRTLTPEQQRLTLEVGYVLAGIFPNAPGMDPSNLNGLTVLYARGALEKRSYSRLSLHPVIEPLYELVKAKLRLPEEATVAGRAALELLSEGSPGPFSQGSVSSTGLEVLDAPEFVSKKFERLKKRRFLANDFYPFQIPNVLLTDPEEQIEVFLKIDRAAGFATIIGERVDRMIHPVELYNHVCSITRKLGITYLEVLIDASDCSAVEFLSRTGFLPCAYVPAFKPQGERRRDYVIFARTYERRPISVSALSPSYREFWQAYLGQDLAREMQRFQN